MKTNFRDVKECKKARSIGFRGESRRVPNAIQ